MEENISKILVTTITCDITTRMVGVGGADGVSFPDVEFIAACSIFTHSTVDIIVTGVPTITVSLSIDPLDVVRTLSIAVSCSIRWSNTVPCTQMIER